ncbi:MAG TPA: DegT/DnrJ/EryC1/StrS family aminotransferase [Blastocatellia bacterium]|nr:DegT/DnrJ/EryC1/StrS family aminotransferase [Blastocatellia bacterium]
MTNTQTSFETQVPFYRPDLTENEVEEVTAALKSGWLTSGPRVRRFEREFAGAVGASHALAVNSCTAALHLAVDALGLKPGMVVLVPAMTFAATAAVVRYQGAVPILVDCDPATFNMNLDDAARKLSLLRDDKPPGGAPKGAEAVGMIPVHVGGMMMDMDDVNRFASEHGLWVVEDAAHAFPAAWRRGPDDPWRRCGGGTAAVTCFSFYANKTITTGEGGMAVTNDSFLAERMKLMSLHGLSRDAWDRYSGGGSWDYKIVTPGFKYNMTDIAAAIGIHQLARAEEMRLRRERIAAAYRDAFFGIEEIELPAEHSDRIHSWHLFPIRLRPGIDRNEFIENMARSGVASSVHWRPLHLHPYYQESLGWRPEDCPVATEVWRRLVTLPLFPGMREEEVEHVIRTVKSLCARVSIARP